MTTPQRSFIDYSTLPPFPAPPTAVARRRPAWLIGLLVGAGVWGIATLLGPVVVALHFDLSPLYPLNIALGLLAGAAYGLVAAGLIGVVTGASVAVARASRAG